MPKTNRSHMCTLRKPHGQKKIDVGRQRYRTAIYIKHLRLDNRRPSGQSLLPSFSLSLPALTTSTCSSPIRSRWKSCLTATKSQRDRLLNCASRSSLKGTMPTHSTQSASSSMTKEGTLKLVDGPVLVNNDRVLLESKTFRLKLHRQLIRDPQNSS